MRARRRAGAGVLAALLLLHVAGCANHGAERRLLEQFFSASRLRDRTLLQQFSTVILEPIEQGTVTRFTILEVVDLGVSADAVARKQVTVSAPVRSADGRTAVRKIVFVLQHHERWMVTGFSMR